MRGKLVTALIAASTLSIAPVSGFTPSASAKTGDAHTFVHRLPSGPERCGKPVKVRVNSVRAEFFTATVKTQKYDPRKRRWVTPRKARKRQHTRLNTWVKLPKSVWACNGPGKYRMVVKATTKIHRWDRAGFRYPVVVGRDKDRTVFRVR